VRDKREQTGAIATQKGGERGGADRSERHPKSANHHGHVYGSRYTTPHIGKQIFQLPAEEKGKKCVVQECSGVSGGDV
jgi:hypothetical protein